MSGDNSNGTPPPNGNGTPNPDDHVDDENGTGTPAPDDWKAQARRHEREAKAARRELEELKRAQLSDTEKAIADAKAEGRTEALTEAGERVLGMAVKVAASSKLASPKVAEPMLRAEGLWDGLVDKDGEPDEKAIEKALDALLKAHPYLAANGTAGPPKLPGSEGKPGAAQDFNDVLRARMNRR
jgi:hypothetical protein